MRAYVQYHANGHYKFRSKKQVAVALLLPVSILPFDHFTLPMKDKSTHDDDDDDDDHRHQINNIQLPPRKKTAWECVQWKRLFLSWHLFQ